MPPESMIPVFDGRSEFAALEGDLLAAAKRVLLSGTYILGAEVEEFEQEFATYLGSTHAVSCASGTDALFLGLRALGVGPGDAVIAPAFTFFATASAILAAGATPVLCDIDPDTFNLDPDSLAEVAERSPHRERLRAILPVHLFGQAADMDNVNVVAARHGLRVLEDAAQAFGATYQDQKVGTLADAGAFSFFPTKNLGGFGDGGMVVCESPELADRLRLLRAHGSRARYHHLVPGTNSRLDALQAAMLAVRLRAIESALEARRAIAAAYDRTLEGSGVVCPIRAQGRVHSFNVYVVRVPNERDTVAEQLRRRGVATAVHYPLPIHLQAAACELGYTVGDFPQAEAACSQVLSLPIYPTLGTTKAEMIGEVLKEAVLETSSR